MTMTRPASIEPHIVETLYCEALVLADEVRDAFDMSGRMSRVVENEDLARIALSCEALRATTRMMHVIAWLLNHRAYFNGEINDFQLRRHGRLPRDKGQASAEQMALLPPGLRTLVEHTSEFHARIARLDAQWHDEPAEAGSTIHALQDRLGKALGGN